MTTQPPSGSSPRKPTKTVKSVKSVKPAKPAGDVDEVLLDVLDKRPRRTERVRASFNDLVGYDMRKATEERRSKELASAVAEASQARKQAAAPPPPPDPKAAKRARRAQLRAALVRDNRNPIIKAYDQARFAVIDKMHAAHAALTYRRGGIPAWQLVALPLVLIATFWVRVGNAAPRIPGVPNQYMAQCGACHHQFQVQRTQIEQLAFFKAHPDNFDVSYPGIPHPSPLACTGCGVVHDELLLTTCPTTNHPILHVRPLASSATSRPVAINITR